MPSLKKNFFYSAVLALANYVFPLITYPYVSRVLGVTGIGICNFVDNIVNWFIVFSTMGIFVIGVREIAAVRSGKQERSEVFSSLLALNGLMTLAAAAVLTVAIFVVPKLAAYRSLLFLGVAKLIAHSLSLEWFFRGLEEFKYITNRSIIIKTLYVVAVFLFVRQAEDYGVYYLLLTLAVVANTLVNVRYARRYVSFSLKGVDLGRFAAPFFILGFNYILTSFYSTLNVIYLGFVQGAEQVGYYTSATKILTIVTALISAFTTVMLPRMSAVLTDGKMDEFRSYVNSAFRILFLVGIPGVFLLLTLSPDIIRVISGAGYEGAVVPMRIVAPMLLISGLDQILIMQIMMPMKQDRQILVNSAIGAAVGILLNLALVRSMGAKGSAVVWLCAEVAVCIAAMTVVFGKDKVAFPGRNVLKMVLLYLPLLLALYWIRTVPMGNSFIRLGVAGGFTFVYFAVVSCWILKDPLVLGLIRHPEVKEVQ
jgi:Membrane protein involved in the export of O-antigen and teichoic acid